MGKKWHKGPPEKLKAGMVVLVNQYGNDEEFILGDEFTVNEDGKYADNTGCGCCSDSIYCTGILKWRWFSHES